MKRNLPKARARTAIYHMLFGKQEHTYLDRKARPKKRANLPELDDTRRFSYTWDWQRAKQVWDKLVAIAEFTDARKAFLIERLEMLKLYPPKPG